MRAAVLMLFSRGHSRLRRSLKIQSAIRGKRASELHVSAKNASLNKNRTDSINDRANDGDTQLTDAGLKQEIKDIEHKLENEI